MTAAIHLRRAETADASTIADMWTRASNWLATLGTDQWQYPVRLDNIRATIAHRELWLAENESDPNIATITVKTHPDPQFWDDADDPRNALYINRMVVERRFSGQDIGAAMLDWVGRTADNQGRQWIRLDAWSTNQQLVEYYLARGFVLIRTVPTSSGYVGACLQRESRCQVNRGPDITAEPW
jgi:GNAT superfamily N-acetyltransferase